LTNAIWLDYVRSTRIAEQAPIWRALATNPNAKENVVKQTEIVSYLASELKTSKVSVRRVLEAIAALAQSEVAETGSFTLANLVRLKLVDKPETKDREVMSFGKKVFVKGKPASKKVKALPAGDLKKIVA